MSEILKSPPRNQKQSSAFFADVFWCLISSWNFPHKHGTWFIWLFIWKRHLRQCNVKSVEHISRRNDNHGTLAKKSTWFFWVPVWRFQYVKHLLRNPNLKLMAGFPNNHYWSYTFLNPWALRKNIKKKLFLWL